MPKMYRIPGGSFDAAKFKDRYALTDQDFSVGLIDCTLYLSLSAEVKIADDPPLFDQPDPPAPLKTAQDYAIEIAQMLMPSGTTDEQAELTGKILRLAGQLPPENKVDVDDIAVAAVAEKLIQP